jgi:N-acyl-D-amino-acid deacylase
MLEEEEGKGMCIIMNGRKESYIFENLRNPYNYIMSDGWGLAPYAPIKRGMPHPRAYGAFPRVLGKYVRDCEIISLQEAIRKMTWGPAQKLGITDRGLLREGMAADVVVFNPTTILDTATFDDPHKFPIGIEYVLVNGQITINEGEHTERRAGKII